jgi:cytochrome c oxidase subunit 7c
MCIFRNASALHASMARFYPKNPPSIAPFQRSPISIQSRHLKHRRYVHLSLRLQLSEFRWVAKYRLHSFLTPTEDMISGTIRRTALAAARQAPRRNFHATPARNGGYHYPEGPRSNLPFDPLAKGFGIKFIAYAGMCTTDLQP